MTFMSDTFTSLFAFLIIFGGIVGWIANIVAIAESKYISGMVMVRIAGIFIAPLGAILGWI